MRAFFGTPKQPLAATGLREAPPACVAALLLTTVACVLLFLAPAPVYRLLQLVPQ
jgi:formate hydrogenlyase subunit 3/multisubunit Na+/H+ antiporter MnhD subunit